MALRFIQTPAAPAAIGPYSQAVQAGNVLFVSGQIGLKPETGEMVGDDFGDQAKQSLENMKRILAAAGYGLSHVVAVDVFLTDMGEFAAFNAIYEVFFSTHKPARAVVEVRALPRGARVEIKCTACLTE
ncbi:MAG: RidA family protein [Syntrophobacteraceae bacterium]|jgi:2-iminobutanoate/2-iminopropanoate deaminase|nr:RidA family protein [Syntrophobacteraceae bacterium]